MSFALLNSSLTSMSSRRSEQQQPLSPISVRIRSGEVALVLNSPVCPPQPASHVSASTADGCKAGDEAATPPELLMGAVHTDGDNGTADALGGLTSMLACCGVRSPGKGLKSPQSFERMICLLYTSPSPRDS